MTALHLASGGSPAAVPLRTFATPAAQALYDTICATGQDDLDHQSCNLWRSYGEGQISDGDATFLGSLIDRRRSRTATRGPMGRPAQAPAALGQTAGRLAGRWVSRQRPRSPDRKASRERRRML